MQTFLECLNPKLISVCVGMAVVSVIGLIKLVGFLWDKYKPRAKLGIRKRQIKDDK